MGEEPDRLARKDPSPQDLARLEKEIEESRGRLSNLIAELDRRRHDLLSFRTHPGRTILVAGAGAAIAAGAVAVGRILLRKITGRRRR
jgi:hypothetical protein